MLEVVANEEDWLTADFRECVANTITKVQGREVSALPKSIKGGLGFAQVFSVKRYD